MTNLAEIKIKIKSTDSGTHSKKYLHYYEENIELSELKEYFKDFKSSLKFEGDVDLECSWSIKGEF